VQEIVLWRKGDPKVSRKAALVAATTKY